MRFVLAMSALALLAQRPAAAAGLTLPGQVAELQVHGFISQGFLLTSANDYLARSSKGSFEFTELGLNFTLPATDRLTLGLQIFSHALGPVGDYRAILDWYSLDYHWRDWLGIRAGRVKVPFGLYNDSSDIDSARTAILLPQSIYPASNRDFLLAQTGGELYGFKDLGAAGGVLASHLPGFPLQAAVAVGMGAAVVAVLRLPLSSVVLATILTTHAGNNVEPVDRMMKYMTRFENSIP